MNPSLTELLNQILPPEHVAFSTLSGQHVPLIYQELRGRYEAGQIQRAIYTDPAYLGSLDPPAEAAAAPCIIITAHPQPEIQVEVTRDGRTCRIGIPPTYNPKTDLHILALLRATLGKYDAAAHPARLPLKSIAARSGLAKYGRNNLLYIRGMGSFFRLAAFYTDYPNFEDHFTEPAVEERCASCMACVRNCPTGALSKDRFMVDTSRCLTFLNESLNPFPDWLPPKVHHMLIGCMMCQKKCPMNRGAIHGESTLHLDDGHPEDLARKLQELGLGGMEAQVARNLRARLTQHSENK